MIYSAEQEQAFTLFSHWWSRRTEQPIFRIFGYAGTGKTTIAKEMKSMVHGKVLGGSFTWKAALRMRELGFDNARSLHSLIYKPVETQDGGVEFEINPDSPLNHAELLIVDEVSMVYDELGEDLMSFDIPILALGDPGQLPPPKGTGFFTRTRPDVTLKEVHRQALESPIIRLATDVRQGRPLNKELTDGLSVYQGKLSPEAACEVDQFITGKNATRATANAHLRTLKGKKEVYPEKDERVICLRNRPKENLFNGLIGITTTASEDSDDGIVLMDFRTEAGTEYKDVRAHACGFIDEKELDSIPLWERKKSAEFTWGYCITGHKSQGSQWKSVCIVDDGMLSWKKRDRIRWLYTCITRAEENLTIVRSR